MTYREQVDGEVWPQPVAHVGKKEVQRIECPSDSGPLLLFIETGQRELGTLHPVSLHQNGPPGL
jgi:hypothetical protein